MLVLSRKPGEAIHIDGDIILKVVEVRGNRVRLGIEAPRSVGIERAEIVIQRDVSECEGVGSASSVAVAEVA